MKPTNAKRIGGPSSRRRDVCSKKIVSKPKREDARKDIFSRRRLRDDRQKAKTERRPIAT